MSEKKEIKATSLAKERGFIIVKKSNVHSNTYTSIFNNWVKFESNDPLSSAERMTTFLDGYNNSKSQLDAA